MRRLNSLINSKITFEFENKKIECNEGETVAIALLVANQITFRISEKNGSARGPYCMMGGCFECLVKIDGWPNRQACMTLAKNGMKVQRQVGPPDLNSTDDAKSNAS